MIAASVNFDGDTARAVALALLDGAEAGSVAPVLDTLRHQRDVLDGCTLAAVMHVLLPLASATSGVPPREIVEGLFKAAPSAEQWSEVADDV